MGAALARALARDGATVAASARRLDLLESLGAAAAIPADLSDPADALRLAEEVLDRFGRVDVLVNNAGVRIDSPVADARLEELDESFQVNVLSPMVLAGRLVPGMVERGSGVVANCSTCHTLKAAGSNGMAGPNLDQLAPDEARVKAQVTNGGGGMPAFAGTLDPAQIDAVAAYVASAAGR